MNIETIIQGGAVGISILLIGVLYFVLQKLFKIITNHLNDQKKATDDLRIVITELVNVLKKVNGK